MTLANQLELIAEIERQTTAMAREPRTLKGQRAATDIRKLLQALRAEATGDAETAAYIKGLFTELTA